MRNTCVANLDLFGSTRSSKKHGECAGESRFDVVRPGDDGCGRAGCTSHDRLGDDNASPHSFQEGP